MGKPFYPRDAFAGAGKKEDVPLTFGALENRALFRPALVSSAPRYMKVDAEGFNVATRTQVVRSCRSDAVLIRKRRPGIDADIVSMIVMYQHKQSSLVSEQIPIDIRPGFVVILTAKGFKVITFMISGPLTRNSVSLLRKTS